MGFRASGSGSSHLQTEGVLVGVPPQTQAVPLRGLQFDGETVADPQQPGVHSLFVALQTQLGLGGVDRAVGKSHPGSRDHHPDVDAHGHLVELREAGPILQRPVVLAALQYGLGVSEEIVKN